MAISVRLEASSFLGEVPNGAIVGLVGEAKSGALDILRLAEDSVTQAPGSPDRVLNQPFALDDAVARELGVAQLNLARRRGAAILLYSHDEALIERLCDEVWWVRDGEVAHCGAPRETLDRYRHHIAARLRQQSSVAGLEPAFRRGDGRAELLSIETLSAEDEMSPVWTSGAAAAIRVMVRFQSTVEDPVVGILIRTRIGLDVFGTNTQLEGIRLGPVDAGDQREIVFRFLCALCPQEYTITAASHDPDGVWHDWMEDAIAVTVTDTRYTAGVANLRASVEVKAK